MHNGKWSPCGRRSARLCLSGCRSGSWWAAVGGIEAEVCGVIWKLGCVFVAVCEGQSLFLGGFPQGSRISWDSRHFWIIDLVVWWRFGAWPCRLSLGAVVVACCSWWLFSTVVAVIRVAELGFGFSSWVRLGSFGSYHF
ncbi:hypothetical protein RHMOL_Rhmol02G0261300 [Rhododendron molle]|uniref:Uncharacterized protein n=1 Tax=Rhododendron molle TaxID=49168 RepID=A0ACC0PTY6_RHOML|nr:hypothetical protein RHMOL_Rhmol02G0261300 [Rhododendron molle]